MYPGIRYGPLARNTELRRSTFVRKKSQRVVIQTELKVRGHKSDKISI